MHKLQDAQKPGSVRYLLPSVNAWGCGASRSQAQWIRLCSFQPRSLRICISRIQLCVPFCNLIFDYSSELLPSLTKHSEVFSICLMSGLHDIHREFLYPCM